VPAAGEPTLKRGPQQGGTKHVCPDFEPLAEILTEQFMRKGAKVVTDNLDIARAGFEYVAEKTPVAIRVIAEIPSWAACRFPCGQSGIISYAEKIAVIKLQNSNVWKLLSHRSLIDL
jgi:hypothetical protein